MQGTKRFVFLLALPLAFVLVTCQKEPEKPTFATENVIVVVVDGPRYTETWGYPGQAYIPFQASLKSQGVFFHSFYNNGVTSTTPGHTAISTGMYQWIDNGGQELPFMPSFLQCWRKATGKPQEAAWIIASKDKLAVLGNCTNLNWTAQYLPSLNCGVNGGGVGSGYRHDSLTLSAVFSVLNTYHPNMVLINFREPDFSAHAGDWNNYIGGISMTDAYIEQLWNFIGNDPQYAGKTALLITNDHGRHQYGVQNGFVSHGDGCDGCRHISLLAVGPDFKSGVDVFTPHDQIDIPATIARLMNFTMEDIDGKVLEELFK